MNKLILLIIFALGIIFLSSCTLGFADCAWSAPILTWLDINENGVWDEGELPIEGVRFQVNDIKNNYQNVGSPAISDWEGKSAAQVWLPGCPSAKFEVLAVPPEGYYFVSSSVVEVQGSGYGNDDPILFPLNRESGFPTPLAYASKLQCKTYPIGSEDLKIAPDGSVWAALWNGGASYKAGLDEWNTVLFDTDLMSLAENIDIGIEGDIWIRSWNGIGLLRNESWEINNPEDTYPDYIVSSINYLSDGQLWFAVPAPPDTFAKFDLTNSSWSLYGPQSRASDVNFRVTLMKGMSTWFAIFEYDPGDAPLTEVPFPGWSTQDTHTFTDDEFNVIPLDGWIEDIEIDTLGKLWIAHSFGISSFSPSNSEWINFEPIGILEYSNSPVDLAVGPDNTIWSIYSDTHPRLLQLKPNNINPLESEWIAFDPRDGFPDDNGLTSLAIDREGFIWVGFGSSDITARCKYLD